jgi:hypothetical protein
VDVSASCVETTIRHHHCAHGRSDGWRPESRLPVATAAEIAESDTLHPPRQRQRLPGQGPEHALLSVWLITAAVFVDTFYRWRGFVLPRCRGATSER